MTRLLTAGIRTGLVAVAMAAAVPMIVFAQTTEPAIESAPEPAKPTTVQASPTKDANNTDKDMSAQANAPVRSATPASADVEMQRRFNELQREILDDREKIVDWWLAATAIFLTLLGLVAVLAGYFSFKRFHEIEAEAQQNVAASKQHAEEARSLVEEIKAKRDEAESLVEELDAETVGKNPDEASRVAVSVQGNPAASLIDQAIAAAVLLQRQGEIEKAIEKWRAVAHVAEESDNALAARAWFSIGYLVQDENPEASISANDRAIRLKPDLAEAYTNRGNAKHALRRHYDAIADHDEAIRLKPDLAGAYTNRGAAKATLRRYKGAITDYDEAIRLNPDHAATYNNRGIAKAELGLRDEARKDFERALALAGEAGNEELAAKAKRLLGDLDKGEGP